MSRKKVLLVDDSHTVLLMERMMLNNFDCELLVARNGKQAVAMATAEQPDVIFMDIVMPDMSGLEACRTLRAQPSTRLTPIIMVSMRGEPHNVEEGYQAGCTEYVTKPFNRVELVSTLKHYLSEKTEAPRPTQWGAVAPKAMA